MAAQVFTPQRPLYGGPVHYRPIINHKQNETKAQVTFDPKKHLNYAAPEHIYQMKDVGYPEDTGISPVAVSEGFSLFSKEAIGIMREEIFSDEVWKNCCYIAGNSTALSIRGHCPKYTPFMNAALTSPETLKIISDIAGIELVPVMDFELGNILIASTEESALAGRRAHGKADGAAGKVTNWHFDHYPFVCVVMLSDVSNMAGGETAIKTAEGEVHKIRGPQMGCAAVMQGRYINHQALAAQGGRERISMVTAFRPKNPMIVDDSHLKYITRIAQPSELYYQWADYRLEILEERIRRARQELSSGQEAGKEFDVALCNSFIDQQIKHLGVTKDQIVPIEQVLSGKVHNGLEIRGELN
ncbi:hypothetical protein L228DRAFT_236122 [Xylona heveae TC161]|uniref:Uncharacterized protein n=1 Tax=Xylona heveae (strain CBS 132557 / TC161) TaxID=1328760 RepID=A0A165IJA0_XYLHT|nr:hypothetical protein L228DRAFT_236122 [Xylona heveae TC161]KZF24973.1 hypothetical protein L228DRAFT_236122 [Xylona heveae TC161]